MEFSIVFSVTIPSFHGGKITGNHINGPNPKNEEPNPSTEKSPEMRKKNIHEFRFLNESIPGCNFHIVTSMYL